MCELKIKYLDDMKDYSLQAVYYKEKLVANIKCFFNKAKLMWRVTMFDSKQTEDCHTFDDVLKWIKAQIRK